jgi:hypothetical protein
LRSQFTSCVAKLTERARVGLDVRDGPVLWPRCADYSDAKKAKDTVPRPCARARVPEERLHGGQDLCLQGVTKTEPEEGQPISGIRQRPEQGNELIGQLSPWNFVAQEENADVLGRTEAPGMNGIAQAAGGRWRRSPTQKLASGRRRREGRAGRQLRAQEACQGLGALNAELLIVRLRSLWGRIAVNSDDAASSRNFVLDGFEICLSTGGQS